MNTKQFEFDAVVAHLYAQGRPAVSDSIGCAYRDEGGLMCAVGCRIPDSMYTREMEGETVSSLLEKGFAVPEEITAYERMFRKLQEVHDDYTLNEEKEPVFDITALTLGLQRIADEFGLTFTVPE
jgi:hypothetical protein